jgi:hypothetical protein
MTMRLRRAGPQQCLLLVTAASLFSACQSTAEEVDAEPIAGRGGLSDARTNDRAVDGAANASAIDRHDVSNDPKYTPTAQVTPAPVRDNRETAGGIGVPASELDNAGWEEFKQLATQKDPSGEIYYIVEGDIPILDTAVLRDYYDRMMTDGVPKGVLHLVPGTATDDVWSLANSDQLNLRYCVDTTTNGFDAMGSGVSSATIIAAMREAVQAWEDVANVNIEYDPGNNGSCGTGSGVPDTRYIKVARLDTLSTACAFGPLSRGGWTCPPLDGNTIGINSNFTPGSWPGTMMHELGHILGLDHEQFHTIGGGCIGTNTRNVTQNAEGGVETFRCLRASSLLHCVCSAALMKLTNQMKWLHVAFRSFTARIRALKRATLSRARHGASKQ